MPFPPVFFLHQQLGEHAPSNPENTLSLYIPPLVCYLPFLLPTASRHTLLGLIVSHWSRLLRTAVYGPSHLSFHPSCLVRECGRHEVAWDNLSCLRRCSHFPQIQVTNPGLGILRH